MAYAEYIADQAAYEAQIEAWREQAVWDGVAKVAIRAYIGCWRRQVFPKPEFSREPFSIICAVMYVAYPERSRQDNSTVALNLLHWTQRVHGGWFSREISKPPRVIAAIHFDPREPL